MTSLPITIFVFVSLVYVVMYEVPKSTSGAEVFFAFVLLLMFLMFLAMLIAELRYVYFS